MSEKQIAAEKSVEFIQNGMTLGIGTGSTVSFMIKKLSQLVKNGMDIKCVSTSKQSTELAQNLGIKIIELKEVNEIDLTIDGADEVDNNLNGIKGGGGALLFEKIVASVSKKVIWVVDSSKLVNILGNFPLPVEVVPMASNYLFNKFGLLGYNPVIRKSGIHFYLTDSGNQIIDLHLGKIDNPILLEKDIKLVPGVIEVGLFNNIADTVIVGRESSVQIIRR